MQVPRDNTIEKIIKQTGKPSLDQITDWHKTQTEVTFEEYSSFFGQSHHKIYCGEIDRFNVFYDQDALLWIKGHNFGIYLRNIISYSFKTKDHNLISHTKVDSPSLTQPIDPKDIKETLIFANNLATGTYTSPFKVNLKYIHGKEDRQALANALISGKCPDNSHVSIQTSISLEDMQAIALVLQHKNCPENLHLEIYCGDEVMRALSITLQSGKCKRGLRLDLNINKKNDIAILDKAFMHGQLPPNFHLELSPLSKKGQTILADILEKALFEDKLPQELNISYLPIHHPKLESDIRIQSLLLKNQEKHTAFSCMILQQGSKQAESSLSILPGEILNTIYAHAFSSGIQSFFQKEKIKTETEDKRFIRYSYEFPWEKIKKKQDIFIKNINGFFAKKPLLNTELACENTNVFIPNNS